MINSELHFTLEEILPKFSEEFQKILHSVDLLRKAEKLALAYDKENGFFSELQCRQGFTMPLSHSEDSRGEVQGAHGSYFR